MENHQKIITLHVYGSIQKEQPDPAYHKTWSFEHFLRNTQKL